MCNTTDLLSMTDRRFEPPPCQLVHLPRFIQQTVAFQGRADQEIHLLALGIAFHQIHPALYRLLALALQKGDLCQVRFKFHSAKNGLQLQNELFQPGILLQLQQTALGAAVGHLIRRRRFGQTDINLGRQIIAAQRLVLRRPRQHLPCLLRAGRLRLQNSRQR
ncbi:MAG: hypothetical protein BWY83_03396 [bacterium ADurb.Bin478]|nr:MAG: hypothetical protein BWY83_03396 [bacterium ADurb.Bin478]